MTSALVSVEIVENERVAGRGAAKTLWVVKQNDAWVRAGKYPGAQTTLLQGGAGTVWEHAIVLEVPAGTEFERVESRPKEPPRRDPLSYLEQGTKSAVVSRRTRYVLSRNGTLLPKK